MQTRTLRDIRKSHPRFFEAVIADAQITLRYRVEPHEFRSSFALIYQIIRLAWVSDAFFAQIAYRAKARLQYYRVPFLPSLLHKVAMMHSQVCIGNPVVVEPGVYFPHGQIVIDGFTHIEKNVVIFPWVTIGLKAGNLNGPTIQKGAHIGTGAKVIGEICVGRNAKVGANAVALKDIKHNETVVGAPAKPIFDDKSLQD